MKRSPASLRSVILCVLLVLEMPMSYAEFPWEAPRSTRSTSCSLTRPDYLATKAKLSTTETTTVLNSFANLYPTTDIVERILTNYYKRFPDKQHQTGVETIVRMWLTGLLLAKHGFVENAEEEFNKGIRQSIELGSTWIRRHIFSEPEVEDMMGQLFSETVTEAFFAFGVLREQEMSQLRSLIAQTAEGLQTGRLQNDLRFKIAAERAGENILPFGIFIAALAGFAGMFPALDCLVFMSHGHYNFFSFFGVGFGEAFTTAGIVSMASYALGIAIWKLKLKFKRFSGIQGSCKSMLKEDGDVVP